jgi:hypothetical protein
MDHAAWLGATSSSLCITVARLAGLVWGGDIGYGG